MKSKKEKSKAKNQSTGECTQEDCPFFTPGENCWSTPIMGCGLNGKCQGG
jgi:hypothetical protein